VGMMLGLQGSKLGDLQGFCRRNKVKTLSVFGSRARGDAGEITSRGRNECYHMSTVW
jgi:predicted nucleotidyltransferase